jgi:hypothetical protein
MFSTLWQCLSKELKDCIGELLLRRVVVIVGHELVHNAEVRIMPRQSS